VIEEEEVEQEVEVEVPVEVYHSSDGEIYLWILGPHLHHIVRFIVTLQPPLILNLYSNSSFSYFQSLPLITFIYHSTDIPFILFSVHRDPNLDSSILTLNYCLSTSACGTQPLSL
jgi:hypothetical protein